MKTLEVSKHILNLCLLDIGLRLDFYSMLNSQLKVNVVTFAYRGYSYSGGKPSEKGLKLDADVI